MNKKIGFIILGAFFAFFIGFGIGLGYNKAEAPKIKNGVNYGNTFEEGWQAARKKLIDAGYIMEMEYRSLNGQIKEVDVKGNKLTFTTNLLNPLDDESLKTRTALINEKTEIILKKHLSMEEVEKEEKARRDKAQQLRAEMEKIEDPEKRMEIEMQVMDLEMMMMNYFKEEKAKISDLKKGFNIYIDASENIAGMKEFIAIRIVAEDMGMADMEGGSANMAEDVPPPPPPADNNEQSEIATPPPPPTENNEQSNIAPPPPPAIEAMENNIVPQAEDDNMQNNIVPPPPPPPGI